MRKSTWIRLISALLIALNTSLILAEDQLGRITQKLPGERMRNSSGLYDPESNADSFKISPGETAVLADLDGPGEIQHIWFTIGALDRRYPSSLVFRIYWDGSAIPSVESPLGDFFAAGNGMRANVSSLPIEVTSYGRALNSYWKMPFLKKAKLTMTNESDRPITSCYFYIDWVKLPSLPSDFLYFHARYNQEWPVKEFSPYVLTQIAGDGQYVGHVISLHSSVGSWFGESDDRFYLDGEEIPSMVGTGFEDSFTDAWNMRLFSNLNAGVTIREWNGEDARITAYRWYIQEPILFKKSLKVESERRSYITVTNPKTGEVRTGDFKYRPDFMSSVSFWYQRTIADRWKPFPPLKERISQEVWLEPREMAELPATETPLKASPGLKPTSQGNRVAWNKKAFYMYNDKPGSWLEVPAVVAEPGRYSISIFQILFREYGIWKLSLKGPDFDRTLDPRMDFYDAYLAWKENYPENELFGTLMEKKVGVFDLKPGAYVFRFECIGSNPLSFDPKTGGQGHSIGLDAISLRKLPWGDMNAWYDDYLTKEAKLFESRIAEAKATVAKLVSAIEAYKQDHGELPGSLEMLIEKPAEMNRMQGHWPYFKADRVPLDPWGQYYNYLKPGKHNPQSYDVWSVHGNSRAPSGWIGNW